MSDTENPEPPSLSKGLGSLLLIAALLIGLYATVPWLNKQTGNFLDDPKELTIKQPEPATKKATDSLLSEQLKKQWPEEESLKILHMKESSIGNKILFDIEINGTERTDLIFVKDEFGRFTASYKDKGYPQPINFQSAKASMH